MLTAVSPVALSFLAGALSASVAWYFMGYERTAASTERERVVKFQLANHSSEEANLHEEKPQDLINDNKHSKPSNGQSSFLRWMSMDDLKSHISELPSLRMSMEDLKSHIGELPSLRKRSHWPWNRKSTRSSSRSPSPSRKTASTATSSHETNESNGSATTGSSSSSPSVKSDFCIGSIFGLDVGGTLAKLVYFEQRPYDNPTMNGSDRRTNGGRGGGESFDPFYSSRERWYRASASAQAVLLARRGTLMSLDDSSLPPLQRQRPRSISLAGLSSNNHHDEASTTASLASSSSTHYFSSHSTPSLNGVSNNSNTQAKKEHLRNDTRGSSSSKSPQRRKSRTLSSSFQKDRASASTSALPLSTELHSAASNADIQALYKLRQESLPDDLDAYEESLHPLPHFHSNAKSRALASKQQRKGGGEQENESTMHSSQDQETSMRRSKSMFDFSKSRTEALDRFYNFARRLDTYREGVKDHNLKFYSRQLGGEFHFIRFETRRMQNAMDLIRANNLHLNIREMGATGGGAHKYAAQWKEELGIEMQKQDELESLVAGMQFVLSTVVGECYTFRPIDKNHSSRTPSRSESWDSHGNDEENHYANQARKKAIDETQGKRAGADNDVSHPIGAPLDEDDEHNVLEEDASSRSSRSEDDRGKGDDWWWSRKVQRDAISESSTYPYLLVTIGTGVSILRVDGPRKQERISGSTIGGGTYWGLIRLLTDMENFEDVMKLAERGDPSKVDMMVGDIYGEKSDALEKFGLSSNLVASSFGKLVMKDDPAAGLKEEDIARALLLMITINIGQVAYLNAQLHNTSRIYFVGNFLRQNLLSQKRLSFAIDYWSKGQMEALFLEHEGYFGALGAFLLSQGIPHSSERANLQSQLSMPSEAFHRRNSTLYT